METPPEFAKAIYEKAYDWLDDVACVDSYLPRGSVPYLRTGLYIIRFDIDDIRMVVRFDNNGGITCVGFDKDPL